jgi:hypothetical protein
VADIDPSDCTVLGMPLDVGEDDLITTVQPLAAVVIVRALDEDGDVVYATACTEGLHSLDAWAMARYAALRLETAMAGRMRGDDQA